MLECYQASGRDKSKIPHARTSILRLPQALKVINVIDSSTISFVANCLDWAKHRRWKAAAKMHLRLDRRSFMPENRLISDKISAFKDAKLSKNND